MRQLLLALALGAWGTTTCLAGPYTSTNRTILSANTGAFPLGGVQLGSTRFINRGLQGVGRIAASSLDSATGESLGSISDMQIHSFARQSDGSYTGVFEFLPDRGYNSGAIYSNYAARINTFDFAFTPHTSNAVTTTQNQIVSTFRGSTRFTYDHDGNSATPGIFTTGLLATGAGTLLGRPVPVVTGNTTQSDGTFAGRMTVDAEGFVLDNRPGKQGTGWLSDEYGANIYRFNANKEITGVLKLPEAVIPHAANGTTLDSSSDPPSKGRRTNQGMEGLAQSPNGQRLFGLLQSATVQDSGTGNVGRSNTRLLVYDVSGSDAPNGPSEEYV
ncbi:MAG: esterase-like activity of phytase family protein, partial [Planctomycetaceae bacterium]